MKQDPSQNLIAVGVLLMLIGLGATFQFVVPSLKTTNTQLGQDRARLKGKQQDYSDLTTVQNRLAAAQLSLASRNISLTKANEVVPPAEDIPGLYIQMEDIIGRSSSLSIKSPAYQIADPVTTTTGDHQIPITISGSGSYANLKAFMELFEKNIRPVSFTTVSFTQAAADPSSPNTDPGMSLSANGYVYVQALSSAYAQ